VNDLPGKKMMQAENSSTQAIKVLCQVYLQLQGSALLKPLIPIGLEYQHRHKDGKLIAICAICEISK
jgi:hypothetical protein